MKTREMLSKLTWLAILIHATTGLASDQIPAMEVFQEVLGAECTGDFDEQTIQAMHAFQEERGLELTDYADIDTLAALEVPSTLWAALAAATGASEWQVRLVVIKANERLTATLESDRDVFPKGKQPTDATPL